MDLWQTIRKGFMALMVTIGLELLNWSKIGIVNMIYFYQLIE